MSADKVRLSVDVPEELAEDLRRYVYWTNGETLTSCVVEALVEFVKARHAERAFLIDPKTRQPVEKPAGEPYPERGELKQGRPVGR